MAEPLRGSDGKPRRDGFVDLIRKAVGKKLGADANEVMKVLNVRGITKKLAKEALEIARKRGGSVPVSDFCCNGFRPAKRPHVPESRVMLHSARGSEAVSEGRTGRQR